ncbi:hypothetical protein [Massilia endophytica]|uniref:hypothetical protein n=1 Tax=Massilia endophytica TaxID=2899220 RepID=UPI001E2C4A75|nr:hypothetical protein [Massilia endophytica]UGQ47663.1 hypothetical protein LSQ66_04055 [Massilia endophytica]
MLKFPGQSLRIGIAPNAVSLLRVNRWRAPKLEVLAERAYVAPADGPGQAEALAHALRALLEGQPTQGWPVAFVLSDELVRIWQVTPPPQAARLADIEAAATLRFHALYGEPPSAWQVSADWRANGPFFAAAVPRTLQAALEHTAQDYGMALVECVPMFVTAWNRWRRAVRADAWFAHAHGELLTLAVIEAGELRALRSLPLPHGADHGWLTQTVNREALLLGTGVPPLVQIAGQLPPALAKPAAAGQVPLALLGSGVAESLSPASMLAASGSPA